MFNFKPGDVFFCRGNGVLDKWIRYFQKRTVPQPQFYASTHCGVIINSVGTVIETTPTFTSVRNINTSYAGSDISILRWTDASPVKNQLGVAEIAGHIGELYPYWRLLAHTVGLNAYLHWRSMECCALSANYIRGMGYDGLRDNLWSYNTAELHKTLALAPDWDCVFHGSLRAAGFIDN